MGVRPQAVPVVGPAVAEDRHRPAAASDGPGPDDEVRLAGKRHSLLRPQGALGFDAVALLTHRQDIARFAVDQVLDQLDRGQAGLASQAREALDEARLQHRVEIGVDVDIGEGRHPLQPPQGRHQFPQQRLGRLPGDLLHVASQAVLVEAAVTAILVRVLVARTLGQGGQGQGQDLGQGPRLLGQELMQIARAPRHRVVQQHEVLARPAVQARFVLQDQAQVIHLAAEAAFQPQLQGRHEGLHHPLIDPVARIRDQDAQGFGRELAIEVQALQEIVRIMAAVLGAVEAVDLRRRLAMIPPRPLHLAAVPAQLEPRSRGLLGRHPEGLPRPGRLPEIDIAEGDAGDELETEGRITVADAPGLPHLGRIEVGQQLAEVVLRLPVLGAVVDAHLGVVAVGDRLTEAQQGAPLGGVGPQALATAGAGRVDIGLEGQVLHVVATGTEAPRLRLGQGHVDLVDLDPALVGVEAVLRGELRQGRLGGPLVAQGIEGDVGPFARFVLGAAAPQHRFQLHPRLREGIVGDEAGVRQGIKQVAVVDLPDQLQQLVPLAVQVVDLRLGGLVLGLAL